MIKAKHTPGPWVVVDSHPLRACINIFSNDAEVASLFYCEGMEQDGHEVWRKDGVRIANARLIAAAPEMLEALRAAHKWLLICDDTRSDDDLKKVEAALRHAEGQP